MKKIIAILTVAAAFALAAISCDVGDKRVTIRFKFKPEMTLSYHQAVKGTMQIHHADSLTRDVYNEIDWDLQWYVRRLMDDQTAEILESKNYRHKSTDKKGDVVKDTTKEGRELIMYVKPDGAIVDIQFTSGEDGASLAYLKNYYEQGMPVFPSEEVRQGQTWTQTTKVILPDGPMEASTKFEIKSFGRQRGYDCAVISYNSNLIIPMEPSMVGEEKLLSGLDNITATGHIYFAYREGFIVEQMERWVLDGTRLYEKETGDTSQYIIAVEYDVDHVLIKVE